MTRAKLVPGGVRTILAEYMGVRPTGRDKAGRSRERWFQWQGPEGQVVEGGIKEYAEKRLPALLQGRLVDAGWLHGFLRKHGKSAFKKNGAPKKKPMKKNPVRVGVPPAKRATVRPDIMGRRATAATVDWGAREVVLPVSRAPKDDPRQLVCDIISRVPLTPKSRQWLGKVGGEAWTMYLGMDE